jgi:GDP-mannose 6-dehydrogenase
LELLEGKAKKEIGIIGLSFKPGTDDLRYSPSVELAESLLGKGYLVSIFDENVIYSRLTGTNKEYINDHIPHLVNLMVDSLKEVFLKSKIIIVLQDVPGLTDMCNVYTDRRIIDVIRIKDFHTILNYEGISW